MNQTLEVPVASKNAQRGYRKRAAGQTLTPTEAAALDRAERDGVRFEVQAPPSEPEQTPTEESGGEETPTEETVEIRDGAGRVSTESVADPMTDEERAMIAAEEAERRRLGAYDEDEGLQPLDGRSRPYVPTEEYDLGERGDVTSRIRNARGAERAQGQWGAAGPAVHEIAPPSSTPRPAAALPDDSDAPIGFIERGMTESSTRGRVDSSEFVQAADELDLLLGSNRSRSNKVFDEFRDRRTGHRFVFRRHYYQIGVLIDSFEATSTTAVTEFSQRAAAIEAYNEQCKDPRERLGYMAFIIGAMPSHDDARRARNREVVSTLARVDTLGNNALDPQLVYESRPAPPGFARIGTKTLALEEGREAAVDVLHDARAGMFLVRGGRAEGKARSLPEAEGAFRTALADVAATAAATA